MAALGHGSGPLATGDGERADDQRLQQRGAYQVGQARWEQHQLAATSTALTTTADGSLWLPPGVRRPWATGAACWW